MTSWAMYAAATSDGAYRWATPRKSLIELRGKAPVPVTVEVNDDGPYWGWMPRHVDRPTHIYLRYIEFLACFDPAPEVIEQAGGGRIVRCTVTERVEAS